MTGYRKTWFLIIEIIRGSFRNLPVDRILFLSMAAIYIVVISITYVMETKRQRKFKQNTSEIRMINNESSVILLQTKELRASAERKNKVLDSVLTILNVKPDVENKAIQQEP